MNGQISGPGLRLVGIKHLKKATLPGDRWRPCCLHMIQKGKLQDPAPDGNLTSGDYLLAPQVFRDVRLGPNASRQQEVYCRVVYIWTHYYF